MYWLMSCSRAARSPFSWYRRRSSRSPRSGNRAPGDALRQLDPVRLAALLDRDIVDDRLEDAPEPELVLAVAPQLPPDMGAERPDRCVDGTVCKPQRDRDVGHGVTALQQFVDGCLDVVEHVVGEVESSREAAEHEVRHPTKIAFARELKRYDVGHPVPSASRSSSSSSCSCAADDAADLACVQLLVVFRSANPWLIAAASAESLRMGAVTAAFTVRTVASTPATASTALSVILSTFSIWALT